MMRARAAAGGVADRWVSGSGGFAGDFVAALAGDFAAHGAAAIAELRQRNPGAYLRLCASVLRHKAATRDPLEALTDAELAARRDAIGARLAASGERSHPADAAAAPRPRRVVAKDAVGEAARERAARPPPATGFEGAGRKEPGDDLAPPPSRDLGRRREDRPARRRGDDPAAPVRAAGRPGRGARPDAGPPAGHERPARGEPERVGNGRRPDVPHAGAPAAGMGCARRGGPREADRRNGAGATPRRSGASVAVRLSVFAIVVAALLGIPAPAAAPTLDVTAGEERRILRRGPWPAASTSSVMPGLVPGIHVPPPARPRPAHTAMPQDVDGRNPPDLIRGAGMTTWGWALREP